jgi:hypothetical protein
VPADRHVLVEREQVLVGDEPLAELLVELSVLVEDRDVLDLGLEGGLDGHDRDSSPGEDQSAIRWRVPSNG